MTVASLPWRAKRDRSVACFHDGAMAIAQAVAFETDAEEGPAGIVASLGLALS
jgi:hypothetical protein